MNKQELTHPIGTNVRTYHVARLAYWNSRRRLQLKLIAFIWAWSVGLSKVIDMKLPLLPNTQDTNLGAGKGSTADTMCTTAEGDVKFD